MCVTSKWEDWMRVGGWQRAGGRRGLKLLNLDNLNKKQIELAFQLLYQHPIFGVYNRLNRPIRVPEALEHLNHDDWIALILTLEDLIEQRKENPLHGVKRCTRACVLLVCSLEVRPRRGRDPGPRAFGGRRAAVPARPPAHGLPAAR